MADSRKSLEGLRRGFEIVEQRIKDEERVDRLALNVFGYSVEEVKASITAAQRASVRQAGKREAEKKAEESWEVWTPKDQTVMAVFYDGSPKALRALRRVVKARGRTDTGVSVKGPRDVHWLYVPPNVWVVSGSSGTYCYDDADFREEYRRVEK